MPRKRLDKISESCIRSPRTDKKEADDSMSYLNDIGLTQALLFAHKNQDHLLLFTRSRWPVLFLFTC